MSPKTPSLTRRHFLKTAAAVAAPVVLPSTVLGKDGAVAPSEKITVGMIGMGRQTCAYNLRRFVNEPDCRVVALSDCDRWRLDVTNDRVASYYGGKGRCGAFGHVDRYLDFRDLLARQDIDAVMISSPDHWHVPMAVMAAQAGKDVCLEKPCTRTIPEGRLLVDTIQKHKRVFRMDSEFRGRSDFHRLCELVRNGRIGKIKRIISGVPVDGYPPPEVKTRPVPKDLDYDLWLGPAPEKPYCVDRVHAIRGYERPGWMRITDYCDGMITNWGTHLNDIVQWANNSEHTCPVEYEAVFGKWLNRGGLWNILNQFEVRCRYADGVELIYKSEKPFVRFEGDEGWIDCGYGGTRLTASSDAILKSKIKPEEIHLPRMSEQRDFLNAVKSRGKTLENEEVTHQTTNICHLAYIAVRVGNGVKLNWDPKAERFTNSDEANKYLVLPPARDEWSYAKILKS